jgi:hypothetical protein
MAMCLPLTPDYKESEMELVNILREIGRNRHITDDNGRFNSGNSVLSCYLERLMLRPFQGKKYL